MVLMVHGAGHRCGGARRAADGEGGSAAGIALLVLVVVLFAAGAVSVVALQAWLLATMQNNHGWMDAVLPCALGGTTAWW